MQSQLAPAASLLRWRGRQGSLLLTMKKSSAELSPPPHFRGQEKIWRRIPTSRASAIPTASSSCGLRFFFVSRCLLLQRTNNFCCILEPRWFHHGVVGRLDASKGPWWLTDVSDSSSGLWANLHPQETRVAHLNVCSRSSLSSVEPNLKVLSLTQSFLFRRNSTSRSLSCSAWMDVGHGFGRELLSDLCASMRNVCTSTSMEIWEPALTISQPHVSFEGCESCNPSPCRQSWLAALFGQSSSFQRWRLCGLLSCLSWGPIQGTGGKLKPAPAASLPPNKPQHFFSKVFQFFEFQLMYKTKYVLGFPPWASCLCHATLAEWQKFEPSAACCLQSIE